MTDFGEVTFSGSGFGTITNSIWFVLAATDAGGATTFTLLGSTESVQASPPEVDSGQFEFQIFVPTPAAGTTYQFEVFAFGDLSAAQIASLVLTNSDGTQYTFQSIQRTG